MFVNFRRDVIGVGGGGGNHLPPWSSAFVERPWALES